MSGSVRHALCALSVAVGSIAASTATTAASTPVAGLATDQACTRQVSAGVTLRTTPYRPDDLAAMTLRKAAFGSAVKGYDVDWGGYGYTDNAEIWKMMLAPKGACALNRTHRRISGFARAYWGAQTVDSAVHLFFTARGASRWLKDYVAGMKDLVGEKGVVSVRVTDVPSLGPGAVKVTDRCTDGCTTTRVFFLRGALIGSVRDSRSTGTKAAVDVVAVAKRLSARMATRAAAVANRGQDPADAVMMLSAGLPRSMLGARYSGLVWDWYYGGCWDAAEAAQSTTYVADRRQYQQDADKFGMLSFCRAMYVPPRTRTAVNGVTRVFNGGFLYTTASGASDAMAAIVREWKNRAGTTVGGTSYGRLVRFDPGAVGVEAVGLQQRYDDATVTRIYFRRGRYLAVDALVVSTRFAGMIGDVRGWARALDRRVTGLLTTRAA